MVRSRPGGRGARCQRGPARGDRRLTPAPRVPAPLHPALDLALTVAKLGLLATPPVPPPRAVIPVTRFRTLNNAALDVLRRALDDHGFRERVLQVVTSEEDIGRPSWLLLARPEGWSDELSSLLAEVPTPGPPKPSASQVKALERKLERAQSSVAKLERQLAESAAKAVQATERAAAHLKDKRKTETELGRARADLRRVEEGRAAALARAEAGNERLEELRRELAEAEARTAERGVDPWAGLDRDDVAAQVAALVADVDDVGRRLIALGRALQPGAAPRTKRAKGPTRDRRSPAPLPPLVYDDALEAGNHLLRSSVLLLIDGYNMTISRWPDLDIAEQRRRLVDALSELAARTHVEVHVVFDGAEVDPAHIPHPAGVRITFTAQDEEADDRILDLIDLEAPSRAVVVASNDGRVRKGAGERGANLLNADQLFHSMRRER